MHPSSRRASFVAVLVAASLALSGLPALAGSTSAAATPTSHATASAVAPVVEKVAGITTMDGARPDGRIVGSVLWDTRSMGSPLGARRTLSIDLAPRTTVPEDATAAVLTVTAVSPTTAGWLTAWPANRTRPTASTLNFAPGTPTPNLAVVRMSPDRRLKVYNGSGGSTHVIITLRGWVRSNAGTTEPGSVTVGDPTRVVDTRQTAAAIPAKGYRDVTVTGVGAPAGATSALLDLVSVKPTKAGYLLAHPSDTARPTTTALTYRVGSDRAALTLVRLSPTGKVRLWNMSGAPVHVVVDAFGWTAAGDATDVPMATRGLTPTRLLDTRATGGALGVGPIVREVPLPEGLRRAGTTVSSAVLSVTATGATRGGHVYFSVDGQVDSWDMPTPSVLNFGVGETVTTTTYVEVNGDTPVSIAAKTSGSVHVVVDLVGVVNHRTQIDGRVVEEGSDEPLPAALGTAPGSYRVATHGDGTFSLPLDRGSGNTFLCGAAMTTPGALTGEDPSYVPACLGGSARTTWVPVEVGARTDIGDLELPRAGALAGTVVGPAGTPASGQYALLQRVDGKYSLQAGASQDSGDWASTRVPVGDWVVTVRTTGQGHGTAETIDEIPRSDFTTSDLPDLLAAGAQTFTVTPGATTQTGTGQIKDWGVLQIQTTDPDGSYLNDRYSIRHSSGYVVRAGVIPGPTVTFPQRPGSYTVCITEGTETRCSGGGTSHETATPVNIESDVTTDVPITVP